jgi:Ca-activated chloride channel family protein
MGLATAVNQLKKDSKERVRSLFVTDGVNNAGFIEPETAADIL